MIAICKNRTAEGETYDDSWMASLAGEDNFG